MSKKDITILEENQDVKMLEYHVITLTDPISKFLFNLAIKISGAKPSFSFGDIQHILRTSEYDKILRLFRGYFIVSGIAVTGLVAFFVYVAYKALRDKMSAAYRACKSDKGKEKKRCVLKFKIDATQTQLKILKEGYDTCNKTKDPTKCKKQLLNKMAKVQAKLKKLQLELEKINKELQSKKNRSDLVLQDLN